MIRGAAIMQVATSPPPTDLRELVSLIRAEYDEMPGLCLTRPQVQRFWLLEPQACDAVLRVLVEAGHLRLTPGGYVRR
jgi:hypothetical protein